MFGQYFHWVGFYPGILLLIYTGMAGGVSGIAIAVAMRKWGPQSWTRQVPIAIIANILVGYVGRELVFFGGVGSFGFLMLTPLAAGLLYAVLYSLWNGVLKKN